MNNNLQIGINKSYHRAYRYEQKTNKTRRTTGIKLIRILKSFEILCYMLSNIFALFCPVTRKYVQMNEFMNETTRMKEMDIKMRLHYFEARFSSLFSLLKSIRTDEKEN